MADDVKVSGPVTIRSDSRERVAFDLMQVIANNESSQGQEKREYWLRLFHQCERAVRGYAPKDAMKED